MTKIILNLLKQTSGLFSIVALLVANSALANHVPIEKLANAQNINTNTTTQLPIDPQNDAASTEGVSGDSWLQKLKDSSLQIPGAELEQADPMEQVTSVSQLSDVQPTDWAFQALQSLVERYGCIVGYPDGTYKGNRAMTRYEFAAGLNACLDRITELIADTSDLVNRDDLATLQKLQEDFAVELAELGGRINALEARTVELEANQFSTTTKLNGEILFLLSDTWGERASGRGIPSSDDDKTQTNLGYRVRLNFDTSFTGKDRLRTRLQANNIPNYSGDDLTNSLMARLGADGSSNNDISMSKLAYRFPLLDDKGRIELAAKGYGLDDFIGSISPFESSGAGSISRFGRFNPTFYRAPSDAGVKFAYAFNDVIKLTVGYAASDPANPQEGTGLFNGGYSGFGQFKIEPSDRIAFQVGYVRSFHPQGDVNLTGSTGSFKGKDPFSGIRTSTDNINFEVQWLVTDGFKIGGWFGSSFAHPEDGSNTDDVTILNGALTLAFPDLLKEGSLGGIIVGVPPIITDGGNNAMEDNDTSIHVEVFYRFQMNDNIAITPGVFMITNPNHEDNNDTLWVGTLRTQFRF